MRVYYAVIIALTEFGKMATNEQIPTTIRNSPLIILDKLLNSFLSSRRDAIFPSFLHFQESGSYLRFATPSLPSSSRLSACWSDIIFLPGARPDNSEQRSERKSITLSDKKLLLPAIRISLPTFIPCLLFTPFPPVPSRSIRFERRKTSTNLPNSVESLSFFFYPLR